jgi:hypothetical protein
MHNFHAEFVGMQLVGFAFVHGSLGMSLPKALSSLGFSRSFRVVSHTT